MRRGGACVPSGSKEAMSRRALLFAASSLVALGVAGEARAQDAGEEPLRRLDPSTLAGGDYGGAAARPLAGGDFGVRPQAEADDALPAGEALADPLSAPPGGTRLDRPRPPRLAPDDPYAPTGTQFGTFVLRPTLETSAGYDSNPDREPEGGKSSKFLRLRGELEATSDWTRHEVGARASGQIRKFTDKTNSGLEPELAAAVTGRLDVTERTQLNAELRASLTTSRPGDPETPDDIEGDEIQKSIGATLGATHRFNRLSVKLEGLVDRYLYNDSKLQSGATVDNSDRVYNSYEARLRGSYEVSPGLEPFAEVAVDTRDYDKKFDNTDPTRRLGSDGYAVRGGARFEATRLITGEAAIGYGRQTPKDRDLRVVDGLLFDGALAWTPTALTTVRLDAKTALQETTLTGAGGIFTRTLSAAVEHRFRRNFIVTARADLERSDYEGIGRKDDTLTLGLQAEYLLNRSVALTGAFSHERLNSSISGEDYTAAVVEFGLRFRR
jgi:hypothetical protein